MNKLLYILSFLILSTFLGQSAFSQGFPETCTDLWAERYRKPNEVYTQIDEKLRGFEEKNHAYYEHLLVRGISGFASLKMDSVGGDLLEAYSYFKDRENSEAQLYCLLELIALARTSENRAYMKKWMGTLLPDSLLLNTEQKGMFYTEYSGLLIREKKFKEAYYYLEKLEKLLKTDSLSFDYNRKAVAYNSIAFHFLLTEPDSAKAFSFLRKSQELKKTKLLHPFARIVADQNEAKYYMYNGYYERALDKLASIDTTGLPKRVKKHLYRPYSYIFYKKGEYQNAFLSLNTYLDLDPVKSVELEGIGNDLAEAEKNYELAQKQAYLTAVEEKAKLRTYLFIGSGLLFVVIVLFLISLIKIRSKSAREKEQAYQISLKEARISEQQKELALQKSELDNKNLQVEQEQNLSRIAEQKAQQDNMQLREEKLIRERKLLEAQLSTVSMSLVQRNEIFSLIRQKLEEALSDGGKKKYRETYEELLSAARQQINLEEDWEQFRLHFERVHEGFFKKLKDKHSALTDRDLRLCAFLRMRLSSKEISLMLGISSASVDIARHRLRKKMELEKSNNLTEYISQF